MCDLRQNICNLFVPHLLNADYDRIYLDWETLVAEKNGKKVKYKDGIMVEKVLGKELANEREIREYNKNREKYGLSTI